jgi:hypothetical protein
VASRATWLAEWAILARCGTKTRVVHGSLSSTFLVQTGDIGDTLALPPVYFATYVGGRTLGETHGERLNNSNPAYEVAARPRSRIPRCY